MAIYSQFTFYKAELNINGNIIEEKLYYNPNKQYHTLYRDFETPIYAPINNNYSFALAKYNSNNINIISVECDSGIPYYKDSDGIMHIEKIYPTNLEYTYSNEYGCGFGNSLGFNKDKEYTIGAKYQLNPDTLIEYQGRYYTKFVAYSRTRHPILYSKNMKITGISGDIIYSKYVLPSSEFAIYIPYEPSNLENYKVIHESKLHDNNMLLIMIYLITALAPAIICFLVWYFFGKEYTENDYPEELSLYPKERKAWEVSVYFHPPFGDLDKNFMPAMILDFYNRKIIDLQTKKTGLILKSDEVFIKILPDKGNIVLDDVEKDFMEFLKYVKSLDTNKDEYFSIKSISSKWGNNKLVLFSYNKLKHSMKEASKEYIEYRGVWALFIAIGVVLALLAIIMMFLGEGYTTINNYKIYIFIIAVILAYVVKKNSLFIRYKKDHYSEYQEWQGFKNYLSHLDSIPRISYKGVIMWEKYLVYATCLGVGKKVLDEMHKLNIIDQKYYDRTAIIYTNAAFGTPTTQGSGGGGMGGGGIGGGGGGGR